MNRNEVKELVPEGTRDVAGNLVTVDEVNMDYGGYRMKVKKGGSIGDFYVTGLKTDDQGRIYVDPNTNTVTTDPNTWLYGGNTEARFRLGWNNRFSYKGVNLGVLFDARIGGQGVSATQALMDRWGASQDSAVPGEKRAVSGSPRIRKVPRCQGLLRQQRQRAFDAFTLRLQHDQRPPA